MLFRTALALLGVIELVFPERLTDAAMSFSTTADSEYELEPWVYRFARIEGVVILLLALRCCRDDADSGAGPDAGPDATE